MLGGSRPFDIPHPQSPSPSLDNNISGFSCVPIPAHCWHFFLIAKREASRPQRKRGRYSRRKRERGGHQAEEEEAEWEAIGRSGGWQSHNKSKSAEGKTFVFVPSRKRMRRLFAKVQIFNGCCCCSVWVRFMERIIGPNGSWHPNALRLINNCNFHGCLSNSLYVIWGAKCWAFPGEVGRVCWGK